MKITLENASNVSYYAETHRPQSNGQGVITVNVGNGTKIGTNTFSSIPWKNGDVFVKVEIDPTGNTTYSPIGTHTPLQSVPYALYAENAKEVVSSANAGDDDPIFEVKNKSGQVVFGVYQGGVRIYVEDAAIPLTKGTRAGFAVGGLTNQAKGQAEFFRITPDSARIYVKEVPSGKGARGGFAVGGLTNQAKTLTTNNMLFVARDSTRIYVNNSAKGTRGGFAVGGLTNLAKGSSGNFLDLTPQNSFIGQDAGKSNTTGVQNAFIGYQAGFMNTNGSMNVFIGNESGLSNTSGTSNIFLGSSSGKNNTTGGNNIFLGTNSGEANTIGVSNIAIGTYAGQSLTTGLKNIFIGVEAGGLNQSGKDNVFIGNFAGSANTSSSNVFIGRTSGLSNTIGTNNVFVGEQTGRLNVEGSGNVFLGDQAGIYEMGSNKLYISNSSTTAPLIYGEFDNSKVAINGSVKLKELMNLQPKTTYPGNPAEGDIFYDANNHCLNFYNGTQWMKLSAVAAVSPPSVSTISIPQLSILAYSSTINCNVSNQGGAPVTQSGVYYSLSPFFDTPSIAFTLYSTPGVGDFSVPLTGLAQNRVYYVRAFATNSQGTSLGNMITFATPLFSAVPTLTTNPVSNITLTNATCGGSITAYGGTTVTAQGICWGTSPNPVVTGSHTTDGAVLGVFTSSITGLTQNSVYYVRAYATNNGGTGYGNEACFGIPGVTGTVSDIDGNSYSTQVIGSQTWMAENLKTTKYRDGSNIPNITDNAAWNTQTVGAYCWYDNDISNKNSYGALYNYYSVVDNRNLCPTGWHVPTDAEWTILTNYLGGENRAGGLLKESGTTHWTSPNTGADNSSGFTALPGGYRYLDQGFYSIGYDSEWWSATVTDATTAWIIYLNSNDSKALKTSDYKNSGLYVRCLMNQ